MADIDLEMLKLAHQTDLEVMKDLSTDIRHCDVISLTAVSGLIALAGVGTIYATRAGVSGIDNGVVNVFLAVLWVAVNNFRTALQGRNVVSSEKIVLIQNKIQIRLKDACVPCETVNHVLGWKDHWFYSAPYLPSMLRVVMIAVSSYLTFRICANALSLYRGT